ncbi:phosphotransferase family protein [Alkalilimnicola ehrlichii]|uniref:Phosphotransferase family protein n=1 Tax=Alkalilimnicola ehrlichii TaxID=351052 RepID=A0A3E0WGD7_9GAMM|nr:phosphotransferase family protein [Alkalilimnicola ehrlichii]RFA24700.1 phosphotransferase family protein [Alkalilimnicola ehrlichii]RFA31798.1 phosphotransferase family protein [Alkalilimnicola ehrlichii]
MSNVAIDSAGGVRSGEELDIQAVGAWLKQQVPDLAGEPEVTQYAGGASNWTYRLRYPDHDWILRRPPAGTKAKSAHDMGREYKVQKALKSVYPTVPEMIALCEDESVIGAEFYVMERIEGVIPRARLPKGLALNAEQTRELCTNVIDKLVELHQVDYRAAGLESLGKGGGYCRRQIEGWSDRYEKARTWNVPSFRYVRAWLQDSIPDDIATCVIHNDWRLDNVVLDPKQPTRVIGVLDWEMATLGDPLMDLGNALAYWVQADDPALMRMTRRQPSHLPGMLTREELVAYYLDRMGLKIDNWAFYEVYGLFRLAVIAQQIYYRYHHKQTRNPAFKNFWILVNYFDWRCRGIIRRSR